MTRRLIPAKLRPPGNLQVLEAVTSYRLPGGHPQTPGDASPASAHGFPSLPDQTGGANPTLAPTTLEEHTAGSGSIRTICRYR